MPYPGVVSLSPNIQARPMRLKAARPGKFLKDMVFLKQEWPGLGHVCAGCGE